MVRNGTFTLLLLQHIQAGQLADVPSILTCSYQEWQFHIASDIKWSKNGNFTLLLTSSGQEWQFPIATDI